MERHKIAAEEVMASNEIVLLTAVSNFRFSLDFVLNMGYYFL